MKPPELVGKKNETDGTRLRRGRQFHFFPDQLWRFHNFMPLKIMKPSACLIFDAKITRKNAASFTQFHVKLATKKKKKVSL